MSWQRASCEHGQGASAHQPSSPCNWPTDAYPPPLPPVLPRLYQVLLSRRGAPQRLQTVGVTLWLFSPFTATISTRGNGEALVSAALLALLLALDQGERCCQSNYEVLALGRSRMPLYTNLSHTGLALCVQEELCLQR